jgi:hypothetical protein
MNVLRVISNLSYRSKPVRTQPGNTYQIKNTFDLLTGENIIKTYECQEGCSRCCGPKTTIALTNNRLITRIKKPNSCCGCIKGAHIDTTIFLRDIEVLSEAKHKTCGSYLVLCIACITCTWPFLLCNLCCGDRLTTLQVKGGFGVEKLTFTASEIQNGANDISAMILPFKVSMPTAEAISSITI